MRSIAVLRPQPQASATAAAALELGLRPIVMPLFSVESLSWTAPDPGAFDALLISSANAILHGGSGLHKLRSLPVCAVGPASAAAARDSGFSIRAVGEGGIEQLLRGLDPQLRLLHLAGERRKEVAFPSLTTIAVYRAAELPIPDEIAGLEGTVALVHSPRAAARLAALADTAGLDRSSIAIVAISAAAAAAAGTGWERVEAAASPTDGAVLALAASLCNNRQF